MNADGPCGFGDCVQRTRLSPGPPVPALTVHGV